MIASGRTWTDDVTRDGNLVTGPDHPAWLTELLDLLGTDVEHAEPATAD